MPTILTIPTILTTSYPPLQELEQEVISPEMLVSLVGTPKPSLGRCAVVHIEETHIFFIRKYSWIGFYFNGWKDVGITLDNIGRMRG